MGSSMAGHLLAAGYPVNVYNRSKDKTNALVEKGAKWFDTVGDLAANSKVIITADEGDRNQEGARRKDPRHRAAPRLAVLEAGHHRQHHRRRHHPALGDPVRPHRPQADRKSVV